VNKTIHYDKEVTMNKIAFITGATSGFGQAAARRFARAGWAVIITGRRLARLQALADELAPLAPSTTPGWPWRPSRRSGLSWRTGTP